MKGLKLVLTVVVSLLLVGVAFADVPAMWKPVRGIALGDQPAITTARVFPDSLWVGTEHPSPAWGWWSKRSVNHGVTWPDSTLVIAGSGHGVPEFRWSEMRHNAKGVHFVMARSYQGQNLITYCRSTDGGMTWGYSRDVTTSGQYPGLAVDPWGVTVVWEYGNMIYARRGTYSGDTLIWNNPVRVDNPIRQDTVANFPQVVTGSDPEGFWSTYCAYRWTDPYHRGSLRVRRASVSGTGWTDVPLPLPDSLLMQSIVTPSIAMNSQGNAFVAFGVIRTTEQQPNPTGERIWVSMVGGSGSTKISNSSSIGLTFTQYQPRIAINNTDTMYVCWLDSRNSPPSYGTYDVYYDRSTTLAAIAWQEQNNSNETYGNWMVNRSPGPPPSYSALNPDLATSPNGKQHFVWLGPWQGAWCALYRARALDIQSPAPPANLVGTVIGCPWGMWPYVYLVWNKNTELDVAGYRVVSVNPYLPAPQCSTYLGFTSSAADTEFYDFSISCTTGLREYVIQAVDYAENYSLPSSAWVCPNCPDDGFSLALDLGQQQASPYTERRAGYRAWGGTPDKTSDVDPDRLVYRVRGLFPDSSYLLALIEYEESSSSGRAQSVWAGGLRLREGKPLPHKPKLSGFRVPKQAYRDGILTLTVKREDGPEVALAALILKDVTHPRRGGPQSAGNVKFTSQNTYLLPPHPNPTSGRVEVEYHLPGPSQVSLSVFNVLGQSVRTLVSGKLFGGSYTEVWDGRDERGLPAKSGVYFVRLQAGEVSSTQRVVLTR